MANNLYNSMQNHTANPFQQIAMQARELEKTFKGNPRDEVQKLLNSGAMSQADFNRFATLANQIAPFMGGK